MNDSVPKPPSKRRFFRFSLRTLLIVTVFVGSCGALWVKREPWTMIRELEFSNSAKGILSRDHHNLLILETASLSIYDFDQMAVVEKTTCHAGQKFAIWSDDSRRFMITDKQFGISPENDEFEYAVWQATPLRLLWNQRYKRKSSETEHEYEGCYLSHNGELAFTDVDELQCIDVESGTVRWSHPKPPEGATLDPTGRFITTGAELLDAKTGSVLWTAEPKQVINQWRRAFSNDGCLFAVLLAEPKPLLQVYETSPFRNRCSVNLGGPPRGIRFTTNDILEVHSEREFVADVEETRSAMNGTAVPPLDGEVIQIADGEMGMLEDGGTVRRLPSGEIIGRFGGWPRFSPSGRFAILGGVTNEWRIHSGTGELEYRLPACSAPDWLSGDRVLCHHIRFEIWARVRPVGRFGFLAIPEFWLALLTFVSLIFSLRADWRKKVTA